MSSTTKTCVACGNTQVPTLPDVTAICSNECKQDWLQDLFNSMEDEDAHCPLCNESKDSVKSAIYHTNKKHGFDINRTKTCQYCSEDFVPTNWNNINKYCSEECFGESEASSRGGKHLGFTTYTCSSDGCDTERTIKTSIYRLMSTEPACSLECAHAKENHWNWQGGSDKIRKSPEYYRWKKAVHQSSDVCEDCGASGGSSNLSAHHVVPVSVEPWKALSPSNGRLLCGDCHSAKHPQMAQELFE